MEPLVALKAIAATLGIVDKATDLIKKNSGKEITPHRVKTLRNGEYLEIYQGTHLDHKIHYSDLNMKSWDEKRYKTLEGKIDDHMTQYNDIDAALPTAPVEEKSRLKLKLKKIQVELCEDFSALVRLHEATLGVPLGDHYSLYDICTDSDN